MEGDINMNKIIEQVDKYMHEALEKEFPALQRSELEKDGAVFYMNGKNGTAFDWYVNDHIPCFFIFYNDKENLGAVKATLYTDGGMSIYLYGDHGHAEPINYEVDIDAKENELLELAVTLTSNADNNRIWDDDIRKLDTDSTPDKKSVDAFLALREDFKPSIELKELYSKTVIVSKKVREGGWKICYGMRDEPTNERDSGWYFGVGNEDNDYFNDPNNMELWSVNSALMFDGALSEFITAPYGTAIVRAASDRFELDEEGKEIFFEKQK